MLAAPVVPGDAAVNRIAGRDRNPPGQYRGKLRINRRMKDHYARIRLMEKVREIPGVQSGVGGDRNGSDLDGAEPGGHKFRTIGEKQHDPIAGSDAGIAESIARLIGSSDDLSVGELLIVVEDRRAVSRLAIQKVRCEVHFSASAFRASF